MRRNPPASDGIEAPSRAVYDLAVKIARLLKTGRCIPDPELQLRFERSKELIAQARHYLLERGARIEYVPTSRCWQVELHDVDWRALRLGELEDLGLLPDDEAELYELVLRTSQGSRKKRPANPQRNVRQLKRRLMALY